MTRLGITYYLVTEGIMKEVNRRQLKETWSHVTLKLI